MTSPAVIPLAEMTGLTPLSTTTQTTDPQAAYARLLQQWGPVAPVQLESGPPPINAWLIMGYSEIRLVVEDDRRYSRDPNNWRDWSEGKLAPDSGLGPMMSPRPNAYFKDGRLHRRLRTPLEEGLDQLGQHRIRRSVQRICNELIDGFADRGHADLVADYAAGITVPAVADWFGIDTGLSGEIQRCLYALFGSGPDSQAGNQRLEQILTQVTNAHKTAPTGDLTNLFLDHPNLHTDEEVQQQMVLMISAGMETTLIWIARTLLLVITDQRFGFRLLGGRLDVDDALDEVLQRDPPMSNMPARYAMGDYELAGQHIRRGDALILGLAAANNDARVRTEDPWQNQGNRSHLAWSAGAHVCPAHDPARIIARTAVRTALARLSGVSLTIPVEDVPLVPSPWTRCPASLPVAFTPTYTTA